MLIDMSVSAGVLIVLTIILEKIAGNYFSKRFIVTMWKIVLLRLIIPINLPITFGIAKPFIGMVRGAKIFWVGFLEVKISPEYIMQQGHQ